MPTGTRTGPQIGSLTRKKRRQRFFSFAGKIEDTRQPDAGEPPQTTKTKEDRPHDHTLPTDPLTHTQTTERDLTSPIRWLGGPLLAGGAAEVGACAGCDGFRDGSRPSRPPHGHARCSRRGRTRLRGRARPPAQLQGVACSCNLRVVAAFHRFLAHFLAPEATWHLTASASVLLRSYAKLRYRSFSPCEISRSSLECKRTCQTLRSSHRTSFVNIVHGFL